MLLYYPFKIFSSCSNLYDHYNWPLICMHNFPPLPISKQIIPVKYFVISNCPQFCILPCDFSCYFSYVILVVPSLLFFSCYFVTVNHMQNTVYANPQPSSHANMSGDMGMLRCVINIAFSRVLQWVSLFICFLFGFVCFLSFLYLCCLCNRGSVVC